jgi:hypothetical protein
MIDVDTMISGVCFYIVAAFIIGLLVGAGTMWLVL